MAKGKNYSYFPIVAYKYKTGENAKAFTVESAVEFKVRGTSHTQHIWDETHINGLAKSAENRIHLLKKQGYVVYTAIADRLVRVLN